MKRPNRWSAQRLITYYARLRREVEAMPPHEDRDEVLSLLDRARVKMRGLVQPDVERDARIGALPIYASLWEGR